MLTNFNKLFIAYFVSNIGSWIFRLAVPIGIYKIHNSAFLMSIAYALTFLPTLLFSIYGGFIADTRNRKDYLVFLDLGAVVISLFLAIALIYHPNIYLILFGVFLLSSTQAIQHPIFHSYLPEVVSKDNLNISNSKLHSTDNILMLFGPIIGVTLVSSLGVGFSIIINSFSFLISAIFIKKITTKNRDFHEVNSDSFSKKTKEALIFIINKKELLYLSIAFSGINFAINFYYGNYIFVAMEILSFDELDIGISIAIAGSLALLGSLLAPKISSYFPDLLIINICIFLAGIIYFSISYAREPLILGVIWGCISFFNSIIVVNYFTFRQKIVPDHLLGSVIAITRSFSFIFIPIGSILGGLTVKYFPTIETLTYTSGIITIISAILLAKIIFFKK